MSYLLREWLNLAVRWTHVFAAIMWVGQTFYFTWLDGQFGKLTKSGNAGSSIWMVHSGGFYVVEKRKVPDELSRKLHWFRWEAATTWLSGMALLIIVYYLGGGALVDRRSHRASGPALASAGNSSQYRTCELIPRLDPGSRAQLLGDSDR